jgi:hypothetical protein
MLKYTTKNKWKGPLLWYLGGVRRKLDEVPAGIDTWQFTIDAAITLLLGTMHVQVSFIGILGFRTIRVE